jgi:cyclopropane-fatty-acyl-phospholipid synthase
MRSMDRLLKFVLSRFIRNGSLTVTTASGRSFTVGNGIGEHAAVRFLTPTAERRLLFDPELALGEIYMDGEFVIEQGTIADVLAIGLDQPDPSPRWAKLRFWQRYLTRHFQQFNTHRRSRRNIERHYDLDGRL